MEARKSEIEVTSKDTINAHKKRISGALAQDKSENNELLIQLDAFEKRAPADVSVGMADHLSVLNFPPESAAIATAAISHGLQEYLNTYHHDYLVLSNFYIAQEQSKALAGEFDALQAELVKLCEDNATLWPVTNPAQCFRDIEEKRENLRQQMGQCWQTLEETEKFYGAVNNLYKEARKDFIEWLAEGEKITARVESKELSAEDADTQMEKLVDQHALKFPAFKQVVTSVLEEGERIRRKLRWTNALATVVGVGGALLACALVAAVAVLASPVVIPVAASIFAIVGACAVAAGIIYGTILAFNAIRNYGHQPEKALPAQKASSSTVLAVHKKLNSTNSLRAEKVASAVALADDAKDAVKAESPNSEPVIADVAPVQPDVAQEASAQTNCNTFQTR